VARRREGRSASARTSCVQARWRVTPGASRSSRRAAGRRAIERRRRRRLVESLRPIREDGLAQLRAREPGHDLTRRTAGNRIADLETRRQRRPRGGGGVRFPTRVSAELGRASEARSPSVSDLPGQLDEEAIVLCRQLVREALRMRADAVLRRCSAERGRLGRPTSGTGSSA
jgi:hypothetical protein